MHMADALVSPVVGATMWAVSGGLIVHCARDMKRRTRDDLVPMMGVMGAFVFAAQMINFSIPGTGSSGHLGGGLMLTILLGPSAAFLVMASILAVQAFFFADGGILALGCNSFNLGFFPSFIAYPFIYRVIAGEQHGSKRGWVACVVASVVGLQLGSLCVVLETMASGISDLSFGMFALLMQPIHLAIGIIEGLATAAVVSFVVASRPEILCSEKMPVPGIRSLVVKLAVGAIFLGCVVSWFASAYPDGLEWSIARISGNDEIAAPESGIHQTLADLQERTAFLPDYGFRSTRGDNGVGVEEQPEESLSGGSVPWPAIDAGTSVSGLVGGVVVFVLAGLAGILFRMRPESVGTTVSGGSGKT